MSRRLHDMAAMVTLEDTDRLPWKTTRRVLALGVVMGGVLDALEWGRREMGREL